MIRNLANQLISAPMINRDDGQDVTTGTTTVYLKKDTTEVGSIGTATYSTTSKCWYIDTGVAGNTDGACLVFTWINSAAITVTQTVYPSYPQTGDAYTVAVSSAAWGYINSGIVFHGVVSSAVPGVSFTIGGLAGMGAGAFIDTNTPWYAYVFRDAGGLGAAPQGEQKKVTGYTSATGLFTTEAFTVPIAAGDDIIIMSGRIAAIPDILADTTEIGVAGAGLTAIGDIRIAELVRAIVNKILITETTGNTELFTDADVSAGTVTSAYTSIAGVTKREALRP